MRESKVWSPAHGIVFAQSPAGSIRSASTAAAVAFPEDLMLHSNAEDRYVNGASDTDPVVNAEPATVAEPTEAQKKEAGVAQGDAGLDELPRTTSSYKIPLETFRAAKKAQAGSADSFWTHTLYRGPEVDGIETKVKVHYCKSKHTTERTLQLHFMGKKVLGFDIEWQPEAYKNMGIKKNISLIQLATEDRIGLFHIALYPKDDVDDLVAPSLRTIMEDASVTKVGVAIKADCTRLRKYLKIESRGIFELSHLYKLVKFSSLKDFKLINKRLVSLSTQVQDHLYLPMFKGENVRGSDWSQPLQMDQMVYAASDSYAGVHLFDTLEIKRKDLNPIPPRPYNAEEEKPIRLAEGIEIQTDEELEPEETEIAAPAARKRTYTKRLSTFYKEASVEMESLDPDFTINEPTKPVPPTTSKPRRRETSLEVKAADDLAMLYRQSNETHKVSHARLRCYYLWYQNPELSLVDIAALLREVPLQKGTVIDYILESVKVEKLPFERERLRPILAELPKETVRSRYKTLNRACDMEGQAESEE